MPFFVSPYSDQISTNLLEVLLSDAFQNRLSESCAHASREGQSRIFTVSHPVDGLDPLAVLECLADNEPYRFYWEKPELDLAMSAGGCLRDIQVKGADRFAKVREHMNALLEQNDFYTTVPHSLAGLHLVGGFSFFEENIQPGWEHFGPARFVAPEWHFVRDGSLSILTFSHPVKPNDTADSLMRAFREKLDRFNDKFSVYRQSSETKPEVELPPEVTLSEGKDTRAHWDEIIRKATRRIRDGAYEKIVLARTISATLSRNVNETRLLHHLRSEYPGCYSFLIQFIDSACFIGSTPERLMAVQGGYLTTEGLAGSIPRGQTATEDNYYEKRLMMSEKDRKEHQFVVDSILSRLRVFTDDITWTKNPGIRKFANVQHLYTPVSARLPAGATPLNVLSALHPTPAVGGVPREETLQEIAELEAFHRGWYAGPVGWLNAHGRGEFSVALRSGLIKGCEATFFAGCGIVAGSDPENEWDETALKLIPMLKALRHA